MTASAMKLGLLLPNQGVVFGATTVAELLQLAETAEASGLFDAVFVGDNLLAKPRLESVTTLSALAARTSKVRLGTACMASFPLRDPIVLAAQWAALDNISEGRSLLVACIGGGGGRSGGTSGTEIVGKFDAEYEAFKIPPSERAGRLEENIAVLRVLWRDDPASFSGKFHAFEGIAVRPQPVQKPAPPIWIANNPHMFAAKPHIVQRTVDRVGRLADGWMTVQATPDQFTASWQAIRESAAAHGRDPDAMESSLYFNLNIDDDREKAFAESKRFLDEYYSSDFKREQIDLWTAYGPVAECAERARAYAAAGVGTLCVRFTAYDQTTQLKRFIEQVAPLL
ncbi:MAG: LLM class flavin-dependent oxidoreductase [bacterium]